MGVPARRSDVEDDGNSLGVSEGGGRGCSAMIGWGRVTRTDGVGRHVPQAAVNYCQLLVENGAKTGNVEEPPSVVRPHSSLAWRGAETKHPPPFR